MWARPPPQALFSLGFLACSGDRVLPDFSNCPCCEKSPAGAAGATSQMSMFGHGPRYYLGAERPLSPKGNAFVGRGSCFCRSIDTPKAPCPAYIPATTYFVNAEPASLSEAGPSATKTLPSSSTPTPSPVTPWFGRLSDSHGGMKPTSTSRSTGPMQTPFLQLMCRSRLMTRRYTRLIAFARSWFQLGTLREGSPSR